MINLSERIDHRSFERQGIDLIPTIHLGAAASQMERRGIHTERGDINREIEVTNQKLRQLKARISKLQTWLKEEMESTAEPTLADIVSNIVTRRKQSAQPGRYGMINNLKAAANILNFLTANNIMDMAGLDGFLGGMFSKQFAINDKLKPIERRLKTLDEHLRHSENYKNYRGHKAQYEKLYAEYTALTKAKGFGAGRKAQKALDTANEYYESNRREITLFESAERYLRDVLQKHFDPKKLPPVTKWKEERSKLIAETQTLNQAYQQLKSNVDEVSRIRSNVYDIVSAERRREQPQRARGMER